VVVVEVVVVVVVEVVVVVVVTVVVMAVAGSHCTAYHHLLLPLRDRPYDMSTWGRHRQRSHSQTRVWRHVRAHCSSWRANRKSTGAMGVCKYEGECEHRVEHRVEHTITEWNRAINVCKHEGVCEHRIRW
jgi:hypothetical protein